MKRRRQRRSALWELERDVAPNGTSKSDCLTPTSRARAATISGWSPQPLTYVCPVCRHTVTSPARNVVRSWCLFCADRALCGDRTCGVCTAKSLLASDATTPTGAFRVADCWAPSNAMPAHAVFQKAKAVGTFVCRDGCGAEFRVRIASTARGSWCTCFRRKSEARLFACLSTDMSLDVVREWAPTWCATPYVMWVGGRGGVGGKILKQRFQYRFDFGVRVGGVVVAVVELDGEQHFRQVSNWASPLCNQVRDAYKTRLANARGIPVVRVRRDNLDTWILRKSATLRALIDEPYTKHNRKTCPS